MDLLQYMCLVAVVTFQSQLHSRHMARIERTQWMLNSRLMEVRIIAMGVLNDTPPSEVATTFRRINDHATEGAKFAALMEQTRVPWYRRVFTRTPRLKE